VNPQGHSAAGRIRKIKNILNLGCLHLVACVRSGDGGFYPSTQRHYRRLILLLILLHVSVVRPYSGRNILLARITEFKKSSDLTGIFFLSKFIFADRSGRAV
jgi:hypothetical protein